MAIDLLPRMVQVPRPAPRMPGFDEEPFEILVDLEEIMRIAGLGDHYVSGLDVVFRSFAKDFCLSFRDQPKFVVIVMVTIETTAVTGNAKPTNSREVKPWWTATRAYPPGCEVENRRRSSSMVANTTAGGHSVREH